MKLIFSALVTLCIIVLVTSCQREVEGIIGGREAGPTASDSIYLKHWIKLDTSFPSGSDTISKITFNYDSQKRIIGYSTDYFRTGTANIEATNWDGRFYQGNDSLPFQLTVKHGVRKDTTFLYYTNDIIDKDSVVKYVNDTLSTTFATKYLQVGPNKYIVNLGPGGLFLHSEQIRINGNLVEVKDTVFNASGQIGDISRFTFDFDTHPNPFKRLSLKYPVLTLLYPLNDSHMLPTQNNDISFSWTISTAGNIVTLSNQVIYTYNSIGYPTSFRYVYPNVQHSEVERLVYTDL